MSYDLRLVAPHGDGKTVEFREAYNERGGTHAVGGTQLAEFNVTYNYAKIFTEVLGVKGIRELYGMTATDSIIVLIVVRIKLGDPPADEDYWAATEGNACQAIRSLHRIAEQAEREGHGDAIWQGD